MLMAIDLHTSYMGYGCSQDHCDDFSLKNHIDSWFFVSNEMRKHFKPNEVYFGTSLPYKK
jgi:hypothetical protein